MSWTRNSVLAGTALVLAALAGTAAADTLVVFSRGPSAKSYPPGKSLPVGAPVRLLANDQLTILDGRGTRTLRGPGNFSLTTPSAEQQVSDINARLTMLTAPGADRRIRIGAVRAPSNGEMRSPNLWFVDVSRPGTFCVADPTAVTLWRPRLDQDESVTIAGGGASAAHVTWPQGIGTLTWPAGVPVTAGSDYTLTVGSAAPVHVKFALVSARPSGMEDTASTLIKDGCTSQLDLLVQTFAVPTDESAPTG